jgi:predicted DNA-binding protein (UPF0251 family)
VEEKVMRDLSESAADKLQAIRLCCKKDNDRDVSRVHIEIHQHWFNRLSDAQRKVADLAA